MRNNNNALGNIAALMGDKDAMAAMIQNVGQPQQKADKPKSEFWLNIGVELNDPYYPFVSPKKAGIPLDWIEEADVRAPKGPNPSEAQVAYHTMTQRQNYLRQLIREAAAQLAPGESRILNLSVELRRVGAEDQVDPTAAAEAVAVFEGFDVFSPSA